MRIGKTGYLLTYGVVRVHLSTTMLSMSEGETATYMVKLDTRPPSTVTVRPVSDEPEAVTVTSSTLIFKTETWNTAQTVTVRALHDADTFDETATLSHWVSGYGTLTDGGTVTVSVDDDDTDKPGLTFSPRRLEVNEGDAGAYTVKLNTRPSGDVAVVPVSGEPEAVTVIPSTLFFTTETWNTAQTVTVRALHDADTLDETATLSHRVSGYGTLTDGGTVTVSVDDDDTDKPGLTFSPRRLEVNEGDASAYTVKLNTRPSGDVAVVPVSGEPEAVTVTPSTLFFTTETWNTAQTVTVRALLDADTLDETATLSHRVSGYGTLTDGGTVTISVDDLGHLQHVFHLPLVMSASSAVRTGFVRIINYSELDGLVWIEAIDDTGRRFGPVSFALDVKETKHFNSRDLERGNPAKGLSAGLGDGSGNWRLELVTNLDIAPLAYVRTTDGFLTSIHETATVQGTPTRYHVPTFNPASNTNQQSRLRLVNPGSTAADVEIDGLDDKGNPPPIGEVSLTLRAGEARMLTAQQLEYGGSGFDGRFGDGSGKWQLFVSARAPLQVMSLMLNRTGSITNLSRGTSPGTRFIPLVLSASMPQQGFIRVINHSGRDGTVWIHATDDTGRRFGPVSFALDAKETKHFSSWDLERGNPAKGLSAGLGDGSGNWRLELVTNLDIAPLAYVRTTDGFLTSIHETATVQGTPMSYHYVPIFNPASNTNQQSRLRLLNLGSTAADVEIDGLDDTGKPPPIGKVSLTLRAGEALMLTAQQLERGGSGFDGRFGDGSGKWQLFVSARAPLQVMSLMQTRSGHLTNLSM